MNQEHKQLLLKDLCARLPYDVKGRVYAETTNGEYDINGDMIFFDSPFDVTLDDINTSTEELHVIAIGNEDTIDFIEDQQVCGSPFIVEEFEPYLRPMSSMTDEEVNEFILISDTVLWLGEKRSTCILSLEQMDWLNAHHFDYRGLIEKGLALEAKEGMYKTE